MDKYFLYDPGNGVETFATLAERKAAEKEAIDAYLEEEWDEGVEDIVSGIITHRSTRCDVKHKPPESELDENGDDEDGQNWIGDYDYVCNYAMKEVEEK